MKKYFLTSLVVFLLAFGCSKTPYQSQVVLNPAQPKATDVVKVTYIPGKASPLLQADTVLMMAQYYPAGSGNIYLYEVPMKKSGNKWVAETAMNDSTGCVLFNFASGEEIDSQDKKAWDVMIYGENNQPVKGAYIALARTYLSSIYMERERDTDKAIDYLNKELELYPDNWLALTTGWYYRSRKAKDDPAQLAKIDAEVDSLVNAYPENKEILTQAYNYFNRKHDEAKLTSLLEKIKKVDPETTIPLSQEYSKIRRLKDTKKQIIEGKKLLRRVKAKNLRSSLQSWLVNRMLAARQWGDAVDFVNSMKEPGATLLNSIAWGLAEANQRLLPAEKFAEKSLAALKAEGNKNKPSYMPSSRWVKSKNFSMGNTLDTYAFVKYKLGKMAEAEKAYKEAYKISEGVNADITEHYIRCLLDIKKQDEALQIAQKAIEENHANDKIIEMFKTAYLEKSGSAAAADSIIAAAKEKASKSRKEEIEKNFITDAKPAPTFALKNLDGKEVSLESLKGKTVIVDFWATWCGPCKSSFPFMQKFWEQHQNDPDVMVVAINCWEQTKGEERINAVKKFMKDHGYTFPVLIDANDKVVSAYKVSGIPTKFFVGPDGKIYFKDVGYHGPTMTDDMNIELEMIRAKVK